MSDERNTNPEESPLFNPPSPQKNDTAKKSHRDEGAPEKKDVEPGSDADASDDALGV